MSLPQPSCQQADGKIIHNVMLYRLFEGRVSKTLLSLSLDMKNVDLMKHNFQFPFWFFIFLLEILVFNFLVENLILKLSLSL